ncbi:hypothetical protein NGB36_19860 [Streptomyces sp. RB6PN25]|uniref:Alpha/beta hydrolase n=1 Tax=Streptomyces humicola TaxID=2953240 RepID=A0ABT1PYN9_9ACTN|nr:hypothetical protein [Streptomyces humicola]MCQ4082799.1 hypothetical protein [Streptomyces humicola]
MAGLAVGLIAGYLLGSGTADPAPRNATATPVSSATADQSAAAQPYPSATGTLCSWKYVVTDGNPSDLRVFDDPQRAAMLAAGRRPERVRSLALIQPSAFSAAADHPVVRAMLERVDNSTAAVPDTVTPEQYLRASTEGLQMAMPEPTPQRLRAVATSMRERPVWEANVPLEPLRNAPWPTLVICGTWKDAPDLYRTYVGEPLMACAEAVADAVGGHLLRVPGYYPHTQQPAAFNRALQDLWGRQG